MHPNIAKPTKKLTPLEALKVRLRKSRIGMIGSGACTSASAKSANSPALAVPRPMIMAEPQAYCVPPQLVSSTRQATAAATSTAPT